MNIGIVSTWYESGASYVSKAYFNSLSSVHRVFVYARGGMKYGIDDPRWNADYVTWGKKIYWKGSTYIDWDDFSFWVSANDLDLVLFNEQQSWDIVIKCRARLDIMIGAYIDYYTPETVSLFWLYDFLFCNTKTHFGVFKEHPQVFYIPWGTDTEAYKAANPPYSKVSCTFFHSCGLHSSRKGTDILINAFQQVTGDAKLIIHSQIPLSRDSFEYRSLQSDNRILLIEKEVGAPGLYHLGDVYVYPTRLEGIGLTIAEALSCGLPVITTNAPPMNEFVINGVNGLLVDVEKTQVRGDGYYWPENYCLQSSLTDSMQYYVDNPSTLHMQRRVAAEHARKHYDWKVNSQDLPDLVKTITAIHHTDQIAKLVKQATRYENSRYYLSPALEKIRGGLHRTGIISAVRQLRSLFL